MADAAPGGRRILLVDDDPAVRKSLGKALGKAGYIVEESAGGEEALESIQRQCPDVLLSDLVIPPPNGEQLAALSRQYCPEVLLIFMSGYSEDELHDLDIKQVVFLPKPIEARELVDTIGRLLA
jgi:two-component system cell cycle sensor histidine kinase/response regulator CckA